MREAIGVVTHDRAGRGGQQRRPADRDAHARERRLIELRFGLDGDPQSLEVIGRELGMSRERVRQLEAEAFAKLELALEGVLAEEGLAEAA